MRDAYIICFVVLVGVAGQHQRRGAGVQRPVLHSSGPRGRCGRNRSHHRHCNRCRQGKVWHRHLLTRRCVCMRACAEIKTSTVYSKVLCCSTNGFTACVSFFPSLTGDHHELFSIDEGGVIRLREGTSLDRESLASVDLRVVATDEAPDTHQRQSSAPVCTTLRNNKV